MSITKEENSAFVVNQQHSNNNVSSEPVVVTTGGQAELEKEKEHQKEKEKLNKDSKNDGTSPPQIILQVPTCVSECCHAWLFLQVVFFLPTQEYIKNSVSLHIIFILLSGVLMDFLNYFFGKYLDNFKGKQQILTHSKKTSFCYLDTSSSSCALVSL